MKVIDVKSVIIGALVTLLILSNLGFRTETDELGHLIVRSLTVEDDRGVIMSYLGNGYMQTYNQFGEPTLFVGTGKDGGGYMRWAQAGWVGVISAPIIIPARKQLT